MWWWRWWMGLDPNRDRQPSTARNVSDDERTGSAGLPPPPYDRNGELEQLRGQVATLTAASAETDRLRAALDQARAEVAQLRARVAELEAHGTGAEVEDAAPEAASTTADMSEAKAVLGSSIAHDDLTAIDGVGPKIAGLLVNAGIDTWRALADTDVERLRAVLDDAGPRYRMHDPSHWPRQAALLADGRWQEFKEATQA